MKTIKNILTKLFVTLLAISWLTWLWSDVDLSSSFLTICGTLCASIGVIGLIYIPSIEILNKGE